MATNFDNELGPITTEDQKAIATRMVEAFEAASHQVRMNQSNGIRTHVNSLRGWTDTSPSWLATPTTIELTSGWDTKSGLMRRITLAQQEALKAIGTITTGPEDSPLGGTIQSALDQATAAAGGFAEGLSEGADNLGGKAGGWLERIEKLAPYATVAAAAIAVIQVAGLFKR